MAFTELEDRVQELHWGPGWNLQEELLGMMFGALVLLVVHWLRTKSFVCHCELFFLAVGFHQVIFWGEEIERSLEN